MHCPRGKVLGGSSSINGMVYVRGHACDFDQWKKTVQRDGITKPAYLTLRRQNLERRRRHLIRAARPLSTNNGNDMTTTHCIKHLLDAGNQAGYGETTDYNGHRQEGFGPMHMTVKNGVRASTSNAYLRRAMPTP